MTQGYPDRVGGLNPAAFKAETLGELLTNRAVREPRELFALFSSSPSLAAGELLEGADRLAARLISKLAADSGLRVIMVMPNGEDLLVTLSACWRLGAVACPLDFGIRPEQFAECLRQFEPNAVILDPGLETFSSLSEICGREGRVLIESLPWRNMPASTLVLPRVAPGDPALCIFTSGSTGLPKGVLLSHQALLTGAANVISAADLHGHDRALCVLPLSHLNGLVTTFISPLASGGSVVFFQGGFDPAKALSLIDRLECTWLSAVPTQYALLMRPPVPRSEWSLASLRFCRSASAPLSTQILSAFEAHYGVPIIETMGMTETAGQIFSNPMPPGVQKVGSIGRPVGFEVRLVDEAGALCPDGVLGEIEVSGPALMSGYVGAPEETAKAYNGTWLKSGDLAERDADGYYFIRGRKKDIAIFSGLNIPLRFLETVVEVARGIPDTVCVAAEDALFGEVVIAYVESKFTAQPSDYETLGRRVSDLILPYLPSPQALREIRFIAALPRSSVGKPLKGLLGQCPVLFRSSRPLPRDARGLLAEALHIPVEQIIDGMGLGLTRGWDSLTHFMLLMAAEVLLERQLKQEEILAITTLEGLASVLDGTFAGTLDVSSPPVPADADSLREREDLTSLMAWNRTLPSDQGQETVKVMIPTLSFREPLSFLAMTDALRQAGLKAGDVLLLHSDVAAMGPTEAGFDREAVLAFYFKAFMTVLGDTGTLCACTSYEDYGRYGEPFVRETSPSRLGAFSEYLRTRPGAVRSPHPIVSVTAYGARSEEICGGAHYDGFGYDSPWGRLHRANAKIMSLGMHKYPESGLTFIHYIEHSYGVPYQYTKIYTTPVYSNGQELAGPFTMSVRYLDYGITYDNRSFQRLLITEGLGVELEVGQDSLFCTDCEAMLSAAVTCLRDDRYYFLESPPRFRPGTIPMDGGTGKLAKYYDKEE